MYSVQQREGTHRPVVDVPDPAGECGGAAQDGRNVAGVRQDKLGPSEASVSPLRLERQSRVSWAERLRLTPGKVTGRRRRRRASRKYS